MGTCLFWFLLLCKYVILLTSINLILNNSFIFSVLQKWVNSEKAITETAHSNTRGQNNNNKNTLTHEVKMKQQKQKNYINNTLKQMMIKLQNPHEICKQLLLLLLLFNMHVSCHRHFFLLLLLNQRWSPPLRLQASHCSTFRIMCDVPSIAVFVVNLSNVFLV